MSDDRMINAIARIERALSRIEAVPVPDSGALEQLQQKYAHLRTETGAALAELDDLICHLKEDSHG